MSTAPQATGHGRHPDERNFCHIKEAPTYGSLPQAGRFDARCFVITMSVGATTATRSGF
jgi:hypothetical protein